MYGTLLRDDKSGKVLNTVSAYQPTEEVKNLTQDVKKCYQDGEMVRDHPYPEYNFKSFVQQANESQHAWLAHPDAPYEGEDEWRWNGVRPITRNRIIFTAARLTARMLYPHVSGQNEDQEEDKEAGYAMETLVENAIRTSNYETAFLFGVISGLVNPINFFQVEFCESWQEAWVQGRRERVLDDVFSGFQSSLVPIDEMLFGNAYVYEWQQQDWLIRARRVSYEEMEGKFEDSDNWKHVTKGVICMAGDDGYFYNVEDINNDDMVLHVNYKHRTTDTELDFVNGVYLSNSNTEYNPFIHRRTKTVNGKVVDVPLYNTVKFGYEPIDAMRFVGYKSLADKMSNDQAGTDREWQDYFDASRLATFQPLITMGAGKIDKSVVSPSVVTEIGKDAKIEPVAVSNPLPALNALREAERSANESSVDPQAGGKQQGPQKTKAEVLTIEENTDTGMGITTKMIARMVEDIGGLFCDDIVRYQTIGEAGELIGEVNYKIFSVPNRVRGGRNKTTYIRFTDRFANQQMTKEERDMEEYKLLDEAGDDRELIEANPYVFGRLNWLIVVDADSVLRHSEAFERTFKLSAYDKAMANPLVQRDPDAQLKITRDFLFEPIMKGDASKYLPQISKVASTVIPGAQGYPQNGNKPAIGAPTQTNDMMKV